METRTSKCRTMAALAMAWGFLAVVSVGVVSAGANDMNMGLTWDSESETVVAEARVEALRRADPEPQKQEEGGGGGQPEGGPPAGGKPDTGNDPRDFTGKFMPYWRTNTLENDMETSDFVIFGMWAMSSKFALTYEVPIARYYDIRETDSCSGLPDIPCFGDIPFEGNPTVGGKLTGAEGDGEEVGLGDSIIRILVGTDKKFLGGGFIYGLDFNMPTATKDILGAQTATIGPIFTFVWDNKFWPAPGSFWAMMNIFQFDAWKDSEATSVGRFLGRWFLQLPIEKKNKLYLMMEFQPIYDWEADHFSFWVGTEFGKAFAPGKGMWRNGGAIYAKPGWGIAGDSNTGDRSWSMEIGFRYFFPQAREKYKMMQQQKGG